MSTLLRTWGALLFGLLFGCADTGINRTLSQSQAPSGVRSQAAINDASAHWLTPGILLWNRDKERFAEVRLYNAAGGKIDVSSLELGDENSIALVPGLVPKSVTASVPHLATWQGYHLDISPDKARILLKGELVVAGFDADGNRVKASYVQIPRVLDALYTQGDDDADEAALGVHYTDQGISVKLWAPTARSVSLVVFDNTKTEVSRVSMDENSATGVWSARINKNKNRYYYRFAMDVYHPQKRDLVRYQVTDPYSLSVSANGKFSQFVNPNDADLMPEGWQTHAIATIDAPEQAVILEGHVRDFSARDESVSKANRGKYLAFTEHDSAPVRYVKALADAGVTHFHFLPINDMGTLEEDASKWIELDSPLSALCDKYQNKPPICHTEDSTRPIKDILASFAPDTDNAQRLTDLMRPYDGFNWGYDPQHFTAPESSYASAPDGPEALLETRQMILALHQMGLRAVLDVVYNHTTAAGLGDKSVLDKTVPGYYHRLDELSGKMLTSTCCANTASEHRMMAKFVTDSLVSLAQIYKYDGFRFDLMEHMPKQLILDAREAVRTIDPDTYFYGEGWNFGEVENNRLFVQAKQWDMAGSEVATFNDRLRDALRSGALFAEAQQATQKADMDLIRLGLAGTLRDYQFTDYTGTVKAGDAFDFRGDKAGYALDPADIINYVSKHDNETLWDALQYIHTSERSLEDRVRIQNIAAATVLMSQGIPFFQLGGDMLRSKSMDRNSYDSGDWFNYIDLSGKRSNWHVGLPPRQENHAKYDVIAKLARNPNAAPGREEIAFARQVFNEFLRIRRSSALFTLENAGDISARVVFHNTGEDQQANLIVMSIEDGAPLADIDPDFQRIMVVINGANNGRKFSLPGARGYRLHPILSQGIDKRQRQSRFVADEKGGTFHVPALTLSVFVVPEQ